MLTDDADEEWVDQSKREARLNTGKEGAHAVTPFQCEICWMRNLEGRNPKPLEDRRYVACLRRANLDNINARTASTIKAHVRRIADAVKNARTIGRTPWFAPRGPFPLSDQLGMGWAVDLLMKSITGKGRIRQHIQFDCMRDLRSTFTKTWSSSPMAVAEGASFSGNAKKIRFTSCPSQSEWFGDFLLGAEDRMGFDTRNQLYLPIRVIIKQLEFIKRDADESDGQAARRLYKLGALVTILTVASLRGHEGYYLDLAATLKHLDKGRHGTMPRNVMRKSFASEEECFNLPEVCICLLGKFKGETGERYHSIILPNETMSGLKPRWWIEKLMEVCAEEGRATGYAFAEPDGTPPDVAEYNGLVRDYLKQIQESEPALFDPSEDLTRYGTSRTYRKASETRARACGVPKDEVEAVNRWKVAEKAGVKKPKRAMVDHYADARGLAALTWRYGYAQ